MTPDPEGLRILREWDMPASRARFYALMRRLKVPPEVIADDACEAGMHKSRIMAGPKYGFTAQQIAESQNWLTAHGYNQPAITGGS